MANFCTQKCFLDFRFYFFARNLGEATLSRFIDEIFEFVFWEKSFSPDGYRVGDQNVESCSGSFLSVYPPISTTVPAKGLSHELDLPCIGLPPPILGHAGCLRLRLGPPSLPLAPSAQAVAFHRHVHPAPGSRDDWHLPTHADLIAGMPFPFHPPPPPHPPTRSYGLKLCSPIGEGRRDGASRKVCKAAEVAWFFGLKAMNGKVAYRYCPGFDRRL